MTRRDKGISTTDDDDDDTESKMETRNGYSSSSSHNHNNHQPRLQKDEASADEDDSNEVIEIDSDDSQDELILTNNNGSSKNEQNNNRDSERESTSSDVVVVSDDYQKFQEDIERLSRINTEVQLSPEDKVSNKNFRIHTLLGTGAYGKVFLVEKLDGIDKGQLYAMKVLEKNKVTQKKKTTEHTRTEREVLEKVIDCPFLATLYYAFQTAEKLYLVMEFVQGGELFSHLYKSENFSEDQVRFYIAEIIVALEQLHNFNIIYRDIKLENILLDAEGHIIITDFGLSKELTDGARAMSYCGTIEYMAPEIVNPHGGGHDLNVDWWSVGVLIIELLSGQSPFSREGEDSNQQLISDRIQRQPPNIPQSIAREAKDLILKLLEKDPKKRLGYKHDAQELKKHKFFRNIDWKILTEKRYHAPMEPKLGDKFDVSQFSEDFTNQPAVDGPAESGPLTASNGQNFFKGYSFVAPHLRRKPPPPANPEPEQLIQEINLTDRPPEMNRPTLEDVFKSQSKRNSTFFKKYLIPDKEQPIGDGTYSLCMKCFSRSTNEEFAVKIMKIDHDASQEIQALEKCQGHKNIVKLVETMQDKYFNYIVFELLSGGELFSRIRESGYLTEPIARTYFQQIVDAVLFTHSQGIIHKDLKPENILFLDSSMNSLLRIVDFGFAQRRSTEDSPPCFTLDYAAPESLVKGETKPSRDLWSLGVILYTMLCGNTPFKPLSNSNEQDERNFRVQITENIRKGTYNMENIRWGQISEDAKDLIEKLIKVVESDRISLDELKDHPWMKQRNESEKSPIRCRAESEETLIEDVDEENDDDDDDAIVINDEEFKNENRDDTRSMDDSSSGIVLSDRNEGSSVSHEEIDQGHMYDNQEEMITSANDPMMTEAVVMVEEQIEPENLSLKDELSKDIQMNEEDEKITEDESVVAAEEVEELTLEDVHMQNARGRKSRIRKVVSKSLINHRKSTTPSPVRMDIPTDLPMDIINQPLTKEVIEEFLGFDIFEDDNNFPCFGFDKCSCTDERESKTLMLYSPLFSYNNNAMKCDKQTDQVLNVVKAKRGRKRKAVENNVVSENNLINRPHTRNAAKTAIKECMKLRDHGQEEPEEDLKIKRPRRQAAVAASKKFFPSLEKKPDPPTMMLKGTRRRAQQPMEVRMQTKIEAPKLEVVSSKNLRRGRPPKKIEVIPDQLSYDPPKKRVRRNIKIEPVAKESLIYIQQNKKSLQHKVEIPKVAERRGRKRKVVEENESPIIEKKTRLATVSEASTKIPPITTRITRTRRKEVEALVTIPMMKIKPETTKPSVIITYQQPQQQLPAPPLSSRFRRTLNNIRNNYVDNKEQPSYISSRFVKPEPVERSAINMYEDTSSLSNYYR